MQRPWLVQTGCAAAELGLWGVERRKTMEKESDEDLRAGPIYKGRLMNGREKRGGWRHDYPAAEAPRFLG